MKLSVVCLFLFLLLSIYLSFSSRPGTIYKLQCQVTGKVYIGRTTRGLDAAIQAHIQSLDSYKRGMCKYELGVFEVIANKEYNVTVLEELYKLANDTDFALTLRKRQRYYLEQYEDSVNKHIPSRTRKEYETVYRDHIIQYRRIYNNIEENKEAHSLTMKNYYQRVKPLRNKTITCEICGGDYINGSSWSHIRTKRHLTALAKLSSAFAPSPQHQQQTLDNLLNSVMTTCDVCGVECTKIGFAQHLRSVRHLKAVAKLNTSSESGPQYQQQLNQLLSAQLVRCDVCGVECMKYALTRHNKSLRHLTALAKRNLGAEVGSQYQQQELNQLLNAQMAKCDICGGVCTKKAFLQHTKSRRHLSALAKLRSGSESSPQYEQQLSELLNTQMHKCDICGGVCAKS